MTVHYLFETAFSKEEATTILQKHFDKNFASMDGRGFRFSGIFISSDEFELRSSLEMILHSKPIKATAYATGKIFTEGTATRVSLVQREKTLLKWFYFIIPGLGPLALILYGLFGNKDSTTVMVGIFVAVFFAAAFVLQFTLVNANAIIALKQALKLRVIDRKFAD